jgi:hypothetical protein
VSTFHFNGIPKSLFFVIVLQFYFTHGPSSVQVFWKQYGRFFLMIVSTYPIGFFQTDLQFNLVSHISQLQEVLQCPDFCISSVQCGIVLVAQ